MKRLLFLAILLLLSGLLAGCSGDGSSARTAHGAARVTLKIALPDRSAARFTVGQTNAARQTAAVAGRLIPSNAARYTIGYKAIDGVTGSVIDKTTLVTAIPAIADPSNPAFDVTLTDLAAGISNTLTVTLYDSTNLPAPPNPPGTPAAVIANGSTTVNLAPGATADAAHPVNITLQSTVIGAMTFTLDGTPAVGGAATLPATGTHILAVTLPNSPDGVPVTTINAANLTWTSSDTTRVQINTSPAQGYSITVTRAGAGAASVTVRYAETINNNGQPGTAQINSATLTLN